MTALGQQTLKSLREWAKFDLRDARLHFRLGRFARGRCHANYGEVERRCNTDSGAGKFACDLAPERIVHDLAAVARQLATSRRTLLFGAADTLPKLTGDFACRSCGSRIWPNP